MRKLVTMTAPRGFDVVELEAMDILEITAELHVLEDGNYRIESKDTITGETHGFVTHEEFHEWLSSQIMYHMNTNVCSRAATMKIGQLLKAAFRGVRPSGRVAQWLEANAKHTV